MWGRTRSLEEIRQALDALDDQENIKYGQLERDVQIYDKRIEEEEERIQKREAFWHDRAAMHQAEDEARVAARGEYWSQRSAAQGVENAAIVKEHAAYWHERRGRHQAKNELGSFQELVAKDGGKFKEMWIVKLTG